MDLIKIKSIVDTLFSGGYNIGHILLKCESPAKITITNDNNGTYLKFEENLPSAHINKLIKFKIYVEGISLGEKSGVIKLKNFPDVKFDYEQKAKSFGAMPKEVKIDNSDEEINSYFKSEPKRKLAKKCLQYAEAWATIASLNGVVFRDCDSYDKFILRNQCYYFVEDQIKNDEDLKYGTFISIFILGLILPAIIKWAVDRVIRALLT